MSCASANHEDPSSAKNCACIMASGRPEKISAHAARNTVGTRSRSGMARRSFEKSLTSDRIRPIYRSRSRCRSTPFCLSVAFSLRESVREWWCLDRRSVLPSSRIYLSLESKESPVGCSHVPSHPSIFAIRCQECLENSGLRRTKMSNFA